MSSNILFIRKLGESPTLLIQQRPDVVEPSKASREFFDDDVADLNQTFRPSCTTSRYAYKGAMNSGELQVIERHALDEGAEVGKERVDLEDAVWAKISWPLLCDAGVGVRCVQNL
jgi:hypothetical protein